MQKSGLLGQIGVAQPCINQTNDELLCIFVRDFNQSNTEHSVLAHMLTLLCASDAHRSGSLD